MGPPGYGHLWIVRWANAPAVGIRGSVRDSFVNRQKGSGVRFVLDNCPTEDKPVIDSVLGGFALFDYDNDGYLDILLTNGATIPGLIKDGPRFYNRLYHNNHDGTFTDVTDQAGVRGDGYSMGAAAADYDNDGMTDLYVTGVNRNFLYRNNGDGTFTDVTEHAGVTGINATGKKLWSVSAAWVDYDNDGRLDLFVNSYLDWTPENNKVCGPAGKRLSCHPNLYDGTASFLYHNNGDGTFTDVSAKMGISGTPGKGMGMAIADYNNDGWMDIFVRERQDGQLPLQEPRGTGGDSMKSVWSRLLRITGMAYRSQIWVQISGTGIMMDAPGFLLPPCAGRRFHFFVTKAMDFLVRTITRRGSDSRVCG